MPYLQLVPQRRRRRSLFRSIRASYRDTRALLVEFSTPLFIFVLITVVGGMIYGELYYHARQQVIPLIDRPYIMLQLMILETPEDVPPEWYLVIFWYVLPLLFIFTVGLGTSDFVRLFFNRDERRDAWREAVASTYRNHIIVFGAGHVGMAVVESLVDLRFDVVVIDHEPDEGIEVALAALDVPLIVGDGRLPLVLEKAGLRRADSLVACTGDDHINLEVIMKVRDMNPDIRLVVRVWEDHFARQIQNFMNVQSVLSSSGLAAPAFTGAALGIDITQTMQVNGQDYSLLKLIVSQGSFMDGQSIGKLQQDNDMDIVLYSNSHLTDVQPDRNIVVKAGDTVVIFAQHSRIKEVVFRNRKRQRRIF